MDTVVDRRHRDRIEPRGSQRSTAHQTTNGQPSTASGAMDLDGFSGVTRACGAEATGRRPTGEGALIRTDPGQDELLGSGHNCGIVREDKVVIIARVARLRSSNEHLFACGPTPIRSRPGGTSQS